MLPFFPPQHLSPRWITPVSRPSGGQDFIEIQLGCLQKNRLGCGAIAVPG